MNHNSAELTFRMAVWVFPFAFLMHVLEEWPRFPAWARKHASSLFTQQDYEKIHIAGIVVTFAFAALVSHFPNRLLVFVFFALVFIPGLLCNSIFHLGSTILAGEYCPGLITSVVLYLPVFFIISRLALRGNLITIEAWICALVIAAVFHTWEVGHNVFRAW